MNEPFTTEGVSTELESWGLRSWGDPSCSDRTVRHADTEGAPPRAQPVMAITRIEPTR